MLYCPVQSTPVPDRVLLTEYCTLSLYDPFPTLQVVRVELTLWHRGSASDWFMLRGPTS